MADIDIEKKKNNGGSKMWLWIIGILVLAGIIWWIAAAGDEEEVEEAGVYEQRISQNLESESLSESYLYIEDFSTS